MLKMPIKDYFIIIFLTSSFPGKPKFDIWKTRCHIIKTPVSPSFKPITQSFSVGWQDGAALCQPIVNHQLSISASEKRYG